MVFPSYGVDRDQVYAIDHGDELYRWGNSRPQAPASCGRRLALLSHLRSAGKPIGDRTPPLP
jgi:hypothetical protein